MKRPIYFRVVGCCAPSPGWWP